MTLNPKNVNFNGEPISKSQIVNIFDNSIFTMTYLQICQII